MESNTGLWVKGYRPGQAEFGDFYAPLLDEFDALWWAIGTQTGPVHFDWILESDENEEFVDAAYVPFDGVHWFNRLWRPGSLKTMAPHMFLDEWSYLAGFVAESEDDAHSIAGTLSQTRSMKELAYKALDLAQICILDVDDGLLLIFSTHYDWLEVLQERAAISRVGRPESFYDFPYFTNQLR